MILCIYSLYLLPSTRHMPAKKKKITHQHSELRQDIVSGEWVLVATGRAKRPHRYSTRAHRKQQSASECPFEGPRINDTEPILWYPHPASNAKDNFDEWYVQVVENLYPAVSSHKEVTCALERPDGLYNTMPGIGYHELIITRPHDRSLGEMTPAEAALVVRSYRERYVALGNDACVAYILVFHNHGHEAGASISHPHSQLIALPVVPPDVQRSFRGSAAFFKKFKTSMRTIYLL
jgi:UDPglucose--hexose-1-phosphate uridylyltransferase